MKKEILLFTILILMAAIAQAQENAPLEQKTHIAHTQPNNIYGVTQIDTLAAQSLTENMQNLYQTASLPQFVLIGKNRSLYFGIGGFVKTTIAYDWGHPITNGIAFSISHIPMSVGKGDHQLVQMSAQYSSLNFNFVGLPGSKHQIGAYIGFNLDNPNYAPHLTAAYVKYAGFTVGYGLSLFIDAAAKPPTIDNGGPNSATSCRSVLIDYQYKWGKHWGFGVGLERPNIAITNGPKTKSINQKVPDIPFYMEGAWNERKSWVRVSGVVRNLMYLDEVTDKAIDNIGWGVKVSGKIVLIPQLTVYYQGLYGDGISSYVKNMKEENLDMLPSRTQEGKLNTVRTWGAYLGVQYHFIPSAFISVIYSFVNTDNYKSTYAENQYKGGQYLAANVIWSLNAQIQLGAEYLWGEKEIGSGEMARDNRAQAMLRFNF